MAKSERLLVGQIYVPVKKKGTLDPNIIREIAESILEIGQQVPILVRRDGERFVLVDGLHRLEACKALGEETILGLFVLAPAGRQEISPRYEAETETLRQRTASLRQLRLAKEAAENSSPDTAAKPVEAPATTGPGHKAHRAGDKSSRLKHATLSEWLADRAHNGFRT